MPVVLGDKARDAERFRFTLAEDVQVVETSQKLDQYLDEHPDESLIVIGPDVAMNIATEVADVYRLRRPWLGVVLMRRRMEVLSMSEALRAGIREVVLADDVEALVGACKRSVAVSNQLRYIEADEHQVHRGKVIVVFSAKGGCGKTTVSTNLAASLAKGGGSKVCLADFDLETGDVAIALQLDPSRTITDAVSMQGGLDERAMASLVVSYKGEFDCLLAPIRPADAELISASLTGEIVRVLSDMYDYVIIDCPPQFSDVVLKSFDLADTYLLLTTLDLPALKSLKVTLDTLDNLGFSREKWHIVLNRGGSRVGLSAQDIERTVGVPIAIEIPSSVEVPSALNEGITVIEANPRHAVAKSFMELADSVRTELLAESGADPVTPKKRGLFGRGHS